MLSTVVAPAAFIALLFLPKADKCCCLFVGCSVLFCVRQSWILSLIHVCFGPPSDGEALLFPASWCPAVLSAGRTAAPVRRVLPCVPLLECCDALLLLIYLSALNFSALLCVPVQVHRMERWSLVHGACARNTKRAAVTLLGGLLLSKGKLGAIFCAPLNVKRWDNKMKCRELVYHKHEEQIRCWCDVALWAPKELVYSSAEDCPGYMVGGSVQKWLEQQKHNSLCFFTPGHDHIATLFEQDRSPTATSPWAWLHSSQRGAWEYLHPWKARPNLICAHFAHINNRIWWHLNIIA